MITYRKAAERDLQAICWLGQVVNNIHYDNFPDIFAAPSSPERDESHWRSGAFDANAAAFVAEYAGGIIGFVTLGMIDETSSLLKPMRFARIGSVCVVESMRGQGIGRSLMLHAERWAKKQGAVDVRLNVWEFNKNAVELYKEIGYEVRSLNMGKALHE